MALVEARNVILQDYDGNVVAGFWQYGSISWNTFSTWLYSLVRTEHQWAIFDFDQNNPDRHGAQQPLGPTIVPPGRYILLKQDASPLHVDLTDEAARPRQPTHSNTPVQLDHYRHRARGRDGKCLITGLRPATWSRLKAAHIFPRAHVNDWFRKGYHNLITDDAPASSVGGNSKIDSIQNVFMLRSDLHDLWDNYEFAVNPDDDYRLTAFVNGLYDVHGLVLQLDHIVDPTIRPLDELFRDHSLQGLLKHMKGAGEPSWDYDDTFGDGAFDLSRQEVWGGDEGKLRLELEISDRLFEHQVAQESEGLLL